LFYGLKNFGSQNITSGHGPVGRRLVGSGFFDHFGNLHNAVAQKSSTHNAVTVHPIFIHLLHGNYRMTILLVGVDHLLGDGNNRIVDAVAQQNGKSLAAAMKTGIINGIAQAVLFFLTYKMDVGHAVDMPELVVPIFVFALFEQALFELEIAVEMVFDGTFAFTRDYQNVFYARFYAFLYHVLYGGNINNRQHLFGLRLGGR
jgi:hypothetical protein